MPMIRFVRRARDYNGGKKVYEQIGHLLPTIRDDTRALETHPLFTHGTFNNGKFKRDDVQPMMKIKRQTDKWMSKYST